MKNKTCLLLFFVLFVSGLFAQPMTLTSHTLNWKGMVTWYAGTSTVHVISFDSAQYPSPNHLPYYNQRLAYDPAFSYQAELKNAVFIPLTGDESSALTGNNFIQSDPVIKTEIVSERGTGTLNVSIFPFVKRDGNFLKLLSFDLQISKTSLPLKIASANNRLYTTTSVLSQGKFVKLRITDSGVYKLTYEDLGAMGVDPANAHIFGYGGAVQEQSFLLPKPDDLPEVAIYMNKGADGVFNAGDYILFYAQGINKWSYDPVDSLFTHKINPYSSYGYYFVSSDAGTGK